MCICPTEKVNIFFEKEFLKYQEELKYLFEVYTNEEIQTLFILLSKLYAGIENLEIKTPNADGHNVTGMAGVWSGSNPGCAGNGKSGRQKRMKK